MATISNTSAHTLCPLSFVTTPNYEANLRTLLTLIQTAQTNSILVAPEVCLTGFDYENLDAVLNFFPHAIEAIKKNSIDKTVIVTLIEKRESHVFNMLKIFHNGEVVYERAKAKLFRLGEEHKHFDEGEEQHVEIVEVDGIKIGVLICFELRFKGLWKRLEGADVIAVPSWWGAPRAEHFSTLTKALAVMNQCYVIATDSQNEACTKISRVITPQGKEFPKGNNSCSEVVYDKKEIALMRRYLDVGIG